MMAHRDKKTAALYKVWEVAAIPALIQSPITFQQHAKTASQESPLTDIGLAPALNYRNVQFLISAPTTKECPVDDGAEVAFAGRSNAGKSSAINALTGNKKMAKTSKTPGRTQLINFFSITPSQRLVDLPGYGYAKVPLAVKQQWQHHLEEYLRERESLRGLILLMDIRHPLQEFDRMMIEWAESSSMAVHVLLTKADKLKNGPAKTTLLSVRQTLAKHGDRVTVQLFSAVRPQGLDELSQTLDRWLEAVDTE